jgi:regulator of nucleoside diphosphate kinase
VRRIVTKEAIPPISVAAGDIGRLRRLALRALQDADPVGRFLITELDRACVCEASDMPDNVVRLDQWVTFYEEHDGATQSRILSAPDDCVNPAGHLSVMSPVGAALLGLPVGARMPYLDDGGVTRVVAVENLAPPSNVAVFRRSVPKAPRHAPDFDPSPDPDPGPSAA